ncbi:MAG: transposase [Desulfobulbaceae bacterium]|jgi:putative transposase|nr:transposase [Desulfobulbaceae bacterium]
MPRQSRIVLPDYPHHIIQRGHNRDVIFTGDEDYLYYLDNLGQWKTKLGCKVYAYCMMSNHVHLIIDPGEKPENLGLLMKRIAGRQTRYINRLEGRTGSLWEGRYKSSPIQADEYLLACCRYIELNPVRAGLVDLPGQYRWSSYSERMGAARQSILDLDPFYLSLGDAALERVEKYEQLLHETVPEQELRQVREAIQRGQLTGGSSFAREVSEKFGRRLEFRGPGRPRKLRGEGNGK